MRKIDLLYFSNFLTLTSILLFYEESELRVGNLDEQSSQRQRRS